MRDLTAVEMIAVAGGLNAKIITSHKQQLDDDSTQTVDVTVRVVGTVTKGSGKPASETEEPATVDFYDRAVMLDAFNRLGIGPARLRSTLGEICRDAKRRKHDTIGAHCVLEHPKLAAAFEVATAEAQAALPKQTRQSKAVAGRVNVTAVVECVDPVLA